MSLLSVDFNEETHLDLMLASCSYSRIFFAVILNEPVIMIVRGDVLEHVMQFWWALNIFELSEMLASAVLT